MVLGTWNRREESAAQNSDVNSLKNTYTAWKKILPVYKNDQYNF